MANFAGSAGRHGEVDERAQLGVEPLLEEAKVRAPGPEQRGAEVIHAAIAPASVAVPAGLRLLVDVQAGRGVVVEGARDLAVTGNRDAGQSLDVEGPAGPRAADRRGRAAGGSPPDDGAAGTSPTIASMGCRASTSQCSSATHDGGVDLWFHDGGRRMRATSEQATSAPSARASWRLAASISTRETGCGSSQYACR
jgi:hypothetical protein